MTHLELGHFVVYRPNFNIKYTILSNIIYILFHLLRSLFEKSKNKTNKKGLR